jgi:hypothetical protein
LSFVLAALSLTGCVLPLPEVGSPEIPSGSVLIQDDFASPDSGWDRAASEGGIMDYDGGGYRILVQIPEVSLWSTLARDFEDTRVEVDAGKLSGPDANRMGLICRADAGSHYFFVVGSDGFYGLGIFIGGEAALLGQAAMQRSAGITEGAAINHLRFDCKGSSLIAYVNGIQVTQVQDHTLKRGQIGLMAGTFEKAGADIVFDNFVVLQP